MASDLEKLMNALTEDQKDFSRETARRKLRERFLSRALVPGPATHAGNTEILTWLNAGLVRQNDSLFRRIGTWLARPVFIPALAISALAIFGLFINRYHEWLIPEHQKIRLSHAAQIKRPGLLCCSYDVASQTAIAERDEFRGDTSSLRTDFGLEVAVRGGVFSLASGKGTKDILLHEGQFMLSFDHSYSGKRGIQLPAGYRVDIIGTKLYISTKENKFEVYLLSGSSLISSADGAKTAMKSSYVYSSDKGVAPRPITPGELARITAKFSEKPMEERIAQPVREIVQKAELPWIEYTVIGTAGSEKSLAELTRLESAYPNVFKVFLRNGTALYAAKKNSLEEVYYTTTHRTKIPPDQIAEIVQLK